MSTAIATPKASMIKSAAGPLPYKRMLFSAYMEGRPIIMFDPSVAKYLTGRIMGVRLESGFSPPDTPHHFLVMLLVDHCVDDTLVGTTREVYVRTQD